MSTMVRYSIAEGVSPRVQLPLVVWTYVTDATLFPVGLVIAASASVHPAVVLVALSPMALLALFARERRRRIGQALTLSDAYQGTALLLADAVEADNAYTGRHSRRAVKPPLEVPHPPALAAPHRRTV